MKILHVIAGNLNGGAAKGAFGLHKALLDNGIDSRIITNSQYYIPDDATIHYVSQKGKLNKISNFIRKALERAQLLVYPKRLKRIFSTGYFGYNILKHKAYKEADIVHLHWINAGMIDIKILEKMKKPIVWTMRDMWPMTGGCHYAMECERFKLGCGKCPQLGSEVTEDLSKKVIDRKIKYIPKSVKIIGISTWLSEMAKDSYIFKNFDIRTISNGVNTSQFIRFDKGEARSKLGIITNKKIVLFGSAKLKDYYKGVDKFLESLQFLDKSQIHLAFFGKVDNRFLKGLNFDYSNLGYLSSYEELNLAYSAADVFVAPSIQEAFGKTLVESLCCGTPVVCFDATGPRNIVIHKLTGYRAIPYDVRDLAEGINWTIKNLISLDASVFLHLKSSFDNHYCALSYLDLYKEIYGK